MTVSDHQQTSLLQRLIARVRAGAPWRTPAGRLLRSEDGPTAVEYAVMLALIVIVSMAAVKKIGSQASKQFKTVGKSLVSKK